MSENKKYYYLKLKDNFYNTDEIKVLEAMPNGYEYSSFYLKICLMSLKEEGRLVFKGRIPYNAELLSTITGHNIDIVKVALDTLRGLEMISLLDSGTMYVNDIQALIGKGSSEGERKKIYRKRIDEENQDVGSLMGQCPDVCPPEIELDTEIKLELEEELDIHDVNSVPVCACPHQKIIAAYASVLPELPQVREWSKASYSNLRARWRSNKDYQSLFWWREFFVYIGKSDFLMGRAGTFQASLDWIAKPSNFAKIINGNYENRSTGQSQLSRDNAAACRAFIEED